MAIYGGMQPSEYYLRRDARKDDKFRDIINLFLQLKQMKQGTEQQEWERGFQEKGQALEEQRMGYMEPYYRGRAEEYGSGPDPTTMMQDLKNIQDTYQVGPEEAMRIYQEKGGPSAFAEKVKYGKGIGLSDVEAGYGAGISRPPVEPTEKSDPVQTKNISYAGKVGSNIQREVDHLTKLLPTRNEWVASGKGPPTQVKTTGEETEEISALEYATSVQARLLGEAQSGRLSKESLKLLTFINANIKNPLKLRGVLEFITERELSLEQAKKEYTEWLRVTK